MRRLIVLTAVALTSVAMAGLSAGSALALSKRPPPGPTATDWRTPDAKNVLVIDTNKGRVIVELVPEVAPEHVKQMLSLAHQGAYSGRTFFRVIDRFMAQTGDVPSTGDGADAVGTLKAEFTFRRTADGGFVAVSAPQGTQTGFLLSLPVVSQDISYTEMTADKKVSAWGTYCPGVVGMARDDNPDSATSQFFMMRYAYPSLDKRYTAFGRVISGLDVIRRIKTGEPVEAPQDVMQKVRVLADIPEAERPKVKIVDPKSPWFAAEVQRVRTLKGADFSVCDIDLPVEVN